VDPVALRQRFAASAGCAAIYGAVLAREYESVRLMRTAHRLTVDAYACQHAPGQSPKSVGAHLLSLHYAFAAEASPGRGLARMRAFAEGRRAYPRLEPPASRGAMTVADVAGAADDDEHERLVERWARSVWEAWAGHHATVALWARELPGMIRT
jgi:hypothetical protein